MEKNYIMLKMEYGIKGINLENVLEFEIESLENGGNVINVYYSNDYKSSYCDDVAFENELKKISESEESRFSKEIFISNLKSRHLLNFNEVKEKLMKLFD
jgi:hypothetical protein